MRIRSFSLPPSPSHPGIRRRRQNNSSPCPRERGFSLLEVIVATAIVALVFVAMMEIFSSGLRAEGQADEYSRAILHANRIMNDLYVTVQAPTSQQSQGQFEDGSTWTASVQPYQPTDEDSDSLKNMSLKRVLLRVEVQWKSHGGERRVRLETIKNVLKESSKS